MRVTRADLESRVSYLARITGKPYVRSGAYGGHDVVNHETGSSLFNQGHISSEQLSMLIAVYVNAYRDGKKVAL